ncbi:MAG TPA: hypothetical protein VG106_03605, partial [Vicinamibacterales bacterium]|nr:hypothetical protein [Vicinamibacterales bacterium]
MSSAEVGPVAANSRHAVERRVHPWLWLSLAAAALGVVASIAGISADRIYARETQQWESQAIAQDIVNLIAYPLLAVFVVLATRGSLRAYLAWLGTLVFSVYTYAVYAFAIHFGPLFLVYVAILGLSAYALIGGMTAIDPAALKQAFREPTPHRLIGRFLATLGSVFALLWLSIEIPAALRDQAPDDLVDVGLFTNPIHVLDLSLLLPAVIAGGVLLSRGRPLGYLLGPMFLVALALLSAGIVSIGIVADARGEPSAWPVVITQALTVLLLLAALRRMFAALAGKCVSDVLRR